MKFLKWITIYLISMSVYAGCDPTQFRWGCSLYSKVKPTKKQDALIYCGTTRLYVSENQFKMVKRYQRAGIHMNLLVDGVYYDGPCIPIRHNIDHHKMAKF